MVEFNGRLYLDESRRQRIDLRLNNAFDKSHYSALGFAVAEDSGYPYAVHYRGLPQTLGMNYTYSF